MNRRAIAAVVIVIAGSMLVAHFKLWHKLFRPKGPGGVEVGG